MISAPTASAVDYCDSAGFTATSEPMQRCTTLTNGILAVKQASNGLIGTEYYKKSGSAVSIKLGYSRSGTSHYASAVSISSGQTKLKNWSLGESAYCSNIIGLMSASGSTYQTPTSHC
ncbi:hypothetical protein [Streptomyces griseorubiginosus]|uniref:hypothetical protein n=1 Tax=Streptomyces griseorubiginosus TaxID=67304 RepID=UPI00076DF3A8|nr:hypothetical protein [Streptomyces griseorubiginosus]KUM77204.1 hypothetical protein AQI84_08990 [Streptomyces griseorubiginosus]